MPTPNENPNAPVTPEPHPAHPPRQHRTFIHPSNGRVVLYSPPAGHPLRQTYGDALWMAMICHVWSDGVINIILTRPDGVQEPHHNVTLLQEGEVSTAEEWCEWMPFQKGQAAKTEAAEALAKSAQAVAERAAAQATKPPPAGDFDEKGNLKGG